MIRLPCLGAVSVAAALVACQPSGSDRPHTSLRSDSEQLRVAFNRDSGMVRVVMLVSPT